MPLAEEIPRAIIDMLINGFSDQRTTLTGPTRAATELHDHIEIWVNEGGAWAILLSRRPGGRHSLSHQDTTSRLLVTEARRGEANATGFLHSPPSTVWMESSSIGDTRLTMRVRDPI
jgi:hypothetical protein